MLEWLPDDVRIRYLTAVTMSTIMNGQVIIIVNTFIPTDGDDTSAGRNRAYVLL